MSDFYSDYIKNVTKGDERTKTSIDAILARMDKILDERAATSQRLSGLVVGRVQSGKTRNYIGLTLKAADAGWNVVIVLTSAIKALAAQTRDRLKEDFKKSNVDDSCCKELVFIDPYDNDEPTVLAKPGKEYFYWGVAMKNSSSLNAVRKWFDASADYAPNMRVLVIDDEADNATPICSSSGRHTPRSASTRSFLRGRSTSSRATARHGRSPTSTRRSLRRTRSSRSSSFSPTATTRRVSPSSSPRRSLPRTISRRWRTIP